MRTKMSLQGFTFKKVSFGCYWVFYQSDYDLRIGRYYVNEINDMTIIDATKNCDEPLRKDIMRLKRLVKAGRCHRTNK